MQQEDDEEETNRLSSITRVLLYSERENFRYRRIKYLLSVFIYRWRRWDGGERRKSRKTDRPTASDHSELTPTEHIETSPGNDPLPSILLESTLQETLSNTGHLRSHSFLE
jgi:hypothetical protein